MPLRAPALGFPVAGPGNGFVFVLLSIRLAGAPGFDGMVLPPRVTGSLKGEPVPLPIVPAPFWFGWGKVPWEFVGLPVVELSVVPAPIPPAPAPPAPAPPALPWANTDAAEMAKPPTIEQSVKVRFVMGLSSVIFRPCRTTWNSLEFERRLSKNCAVSCFSNKLVEDS